MPILDDFAQMLDRTGQTANAKFLRDTMAELKRGPNPRLAYLKSSVRYSSSSCLFFLGLSPIPVLALYFFPDHLYPMSSVFASFATFAVFHGFCWRRAVKALRAEEILDTMES